MSGVRALHDQATTAEAAIEWVMAHSGADATFATVFTEETRLTRMAGLTVHQHVGEVTRRIYLRTVWQGREVEVNGDDLSEKGLQRLLSKSWDLAATGRAAKAKALESHGGGRESFDVSEEAARVADLTDTDRALLLLRMRDVFRRAGVDGAGNVKQQVATLAYGDSAGARRFAAIPSLSAVAVGLDLDNLASGYQSWAGSDVASFDPEGMATKAAIRCLLGRRPRLVEPTDLPVILEPAAVAQLLFHLNFRSLGLFGASSAIRKQNVVYDNLGWKLTSERFTLVDDFRAPGMVRVPFDFEGRDRKRLEIVVAGVANEIAHDVGTAAVLGAESTGHALPKTAGFGPSPQHLALEAGDTSVADMIASMDLGILVSRIHGFVSPLSGKQGFLSGTTRDGVFLVEKGSIAAPIRNLRWRDRIFDAFGTISAVSREREMHFTDELLFPTQTLVPTIRLERFNFVDAQRWSE